MPSLLSDNNINNNINNNSWVTEDRKFAMKQELRSMKHIIDHIVEYCSYSSESKNNNDNNNSDNNFEFCDDLMLLHIVKTDLSDVDKHLLVLHETVS